MTEASLTHQLRTELNQRLSLVFPDSNDPFGREVAQAHSYPLASGGKRVRPIVTLLAAGSFACQRGLALAWPFALALELVHTYSLVHDDLPCMDNDDLRRGRPTVHKVYGDAKGLLVGDGLLTRAFGLLGEGNEQMTTDPLELYLRLQGVDILARAAGDAGMIAGQWMDMSCSSETRENSATILERLQLLKTGKLLGAAFEMGFLAGLAGREGQVEALLSGRAQHVRTLARETGEALGVAFQICDDLLDATASSSEVGKSVGKDAKQHKLTAVSVFGAGRAQDLAKHWTDRGLLGLEKVLAHRAGVTTEQDSYGSELTELCHALLFRKL